jgi:hypothetical protein
MFYVKNVPNWERALRVVAGLAAIYLGLAVLGGMWGAVAAAAAAGIVGSGLFGFCPMCALVGRRLDNAAKQGNI